MKMKFKINLFVSKYKQSRQCYSCLCIIWNWVFDKICFVLFNYFDVVYDPIGQNIM